MAVIARKQLTGSTQKIKEYAGHEGQLVFDKQTKHLHVLSGTAGKTTELANKSDIPTVDGNTSEYVGTIKNLNFDVNTGAVTIIKSNDTVVPRKLATDLYVADKLKTKEDKGTAYSKVESDGKYSTKAEVTQGLAGKAPTAHTHTKSQITDFPTIPDTSTLIPKSGARGILAGYEQTQNITTDFLDKSTADSSMSGSNLIVREGDDTDAFTKSVFVTGGTVNLGPNWKWVGGKAPELKFPGVLVCHWNGGSGIVNFIPWE